MKVRAMLTRAAGFPAKALPGHKANTFIEGTLVGSQVVVPPGPTTNMLEPLGMKRAPWLVLPFAGGKLEWVACDEDPTYALLGVMPVAQPIVPRKNKKADEEA